MDTRAEREGKGKWGELCEEESLSYGGKITRVVMGSNIPHSRYSVSFLILH